MLSAGKTVIIDFNDSFTYNIFELLRRIGFSDFSILPVDKLSKRMSDVDFEMPEKLILSPGPGLPSDYPIVFKFLDRIVESAVPVLGICLGHQMLYSYFGGSLKNLKAVVHGQPRTIHTLAVDPLMFGMPDRFLAGLYHSWAAEKPIPEQLELLAESEDGTIMAVRHKSLQAWGVQFHPESFITEYGEQLLSNFLII